MADTNMINIKVLDIDITVDNRCTRDYRILKYLGELDKGNPLHAADLIRMFVGENEEKIMEAIMEKNDGWCPIEAVTEVINEIVTQLSQKDEAAKK